MSDMLTLDDLAASLHALRELATDFGHLPAPTVEVSPIFPNRLQMVFHGFTSTSLSDFEAWREALGIAPEAVTYGTQQADRTRVLCVRVDYAGAELELTAFADIPAPALAEGRAA